MNKDTVKGTIDEVVGSAKQEFGELTGSTTTQVKGAVQYLKGKAEIGIGHLKDAGRHAQENFHAAEDAEEPVVVVHREVTISDDPILP